MFSRKFFLISAILVLFAAVAFCVPASSIRDAAMSKDSADETIEYLLANISSADSASEKRGLWCLTGNLQELCNDWMGAAKSYLQALRISGSNPPGFEAFSVDRLRIAAARCFLNYGDYENAELNLNAFANSSNDAELKALSNLYSVWVALCKAKTASQILDPLSKLKSYLDSDSMKSVRAGMLFTLWYVGGEQKYLDMLKKEFPKSAEYSVASGKSKLVSAPFWYIVPRYADGSDQNAKSSVETKSEKPKEEKSAAKTGAKTESKSAAKTETKAEPKASVKEEKPKLVREQLGLFRSQSNAQALIESAKEKGFSAYYFTETRASGTTYYIVVVDENQEGTMGKKLRAAGFDCYPVD